VLSVVQPIHLLDTPIKQRKKDIRFCERFGLTPGEVIIKEYSCSFAIGMLNISKHGHGTLYISNRVRNSNQSSISWLHSLKCNFFIDILIFSY
jgi:hypothetical protein